MNLKVIWNHLAAAFFLLPASLHLNAQTTADVIVYGSTPGGYCAAIAAAREGASVILLEPTQHVGGMNTGGLSFSDSNQMYRDKLMGLFHEWHLRIQQDYQSRGVTLPYDVNVKNQADWSYEPHVASRVTNAMLSEAGVTVLTGRYLQSVNKTGPRISSIVTSNGTFSGRVFIDGSYEGDLMAAAGVSWTIGREGRATFNESHAGKQFPTQKPNMNINGFDAQGNPLPLITGTSAGPSADGDDNIMTYSFRLSMTTNAANKVPVPAPANYDPARFEVVRRYVQQHGPTQADFDRYTVPGNKIDGNNGIYKQFSIGLVGGAKGWATADQAGRAAIFEAHKQYTLEFLHFLKTDPVFTQARRDSIAQWGFCADEFAATGHFSPALYVRESRRMQGMYVIKQADILTDIVKPDPIMVASFPIDSHDCQRIATAGGGVRNEGTIFPVRQTSRIGYPHHVPYRSILPQPAQCDNLLVPVALSCTHVAISSLRIEATWMLIGQSAGIAAALAAAQDVTVQDLPYATLQPRLLAQGQVLTLPAGFQPLEGIILDDPSAVLTGTWGSSTTATPYQGAGYRFAGAAGVPNNGSATATFRFTATEAGTYKLNMAYSPDPSRASNVPLTITSGPHVTNLTVDQTLARTSLMREIGTVPLVAGQETVITIGTAGTTGFVILDALQLVFETPAAATSWTAPGAAGVTTNSADISATLLGTEAEVTLYWKAGGSAPQQFTGWDGELSNPGVNVSPGLVSRTITGLQPDTLYSCIFYAYNETIPSEAWSAPLTFATALSAAQVPVFTSTVAGTSSITLNWQDNATHETGYILQRATSPAGAYATIATPNANATTYMDSAIPTSGSYYYQLAATNVANGSTTDFSASQTSATITLPLPAFAESFSSPYQVGATSPLNGTTPGTTTTGAVWSSSDWRENGTAPASNDSNQDDSAFLPFQPVAGNIYTLSATLTQPTGGGSTGWVAIGFTNTATITGSFWANNASPWIQRRPSNGTPASEVVSWLGPGTTGSLNEGPQTGTATLSIVLNTQAAAWTAEWFVNGASLRSETCGTNPTINHIGFGRENGQSSTFSDFSLIAIGTAGTFTLTLSPSALNPGHYDFEWNSRSGKIYDLVGSTELTAAPATWAVWNGRAGIPATPPTNTLSNIPGNGDPRRFFALVER